MVGKKLYAGIMVLLISVFMVACSEDAGSDQEQKDTEAQEETNNDTEKEENAIPSDEELFAVLDDNVQTLMDKDIDAYMETIHSESPVYENTKKVMEQFSAYTVDIELSDMKVEEKTKDEARIAYSQTSIKVEGPAYQNNKIKGVQILRPEDGVWKIYNTELVETIPLDENGEPMDTQTDMQAGGATLEGKFAEDIKALTIPFITNEWILTNYQEVDSSASAELTKGAEIITIVFHKDGKNLVDTKTWISNIKSQLTASVTGKLQFNELEATAQEGMYEFTLSGDEALYDQAEIGRGFFKGNDLYIISYTVMQQSKIDDVAKNEWVEKLKSIK